MDARITFSKETRAKMDRGMTVREKGRVMFDRLKELDQDGTLSKAKSRADVARLVGYSNQRAKAGYAWVSNLLRRGHLTETILEWSPSGRAECEYHITDTKPDYGYEEVNRRREKKGVGQELRRWQDKVAAGYIPQAPESPIIERATINNPIKVEITRGDTTIKVEMGDYEKVSEIVKEVLKG